MKELSVQDIKDLMEAFHKNKMGALKLKGEGVSLELRDREAPQVIAPPQGFDAGGPTAVFTTALQNPAAAAEAPAEPAHRGRAVNSPIVGTFYAAPGPDKDPYVRVGSQVKKGDVLFIIESMKLMNEVTSELDGTVTEIVVDNAQGVEYGQPILYID